MLTIAKPLASKLRSGVAVCLVAAALSACGGTKWGFPYRADVQQGNWVTEEQVSRLELGMTREQVRYVLGTPTLQDIFHSNRWDYPFYSKPGYGEPEDRRFTVWFENDQLVRWEGDEQPNYQPFQAPDPDTPVRHTDTAAPTDAVPDENTEASRPPEDMTPIGLEAPSTLDTPSVLERGSTPNEPAPQPLR